MFKSRFYVLLATLVITTICRNISLYNKELVKTFHAVNDTDYVSSSSQSYASTVKHNENCSTFSLRNQSSVTIQETGYNESKSSASLLHPVTYSILKGDRVIFFDFGRTSRFHGLFSLTNIIVELWMYAEDALDERDVIIVLNQINMPVYRYNNSLGFWGGFTLPPQHHPIFINSQQEMSLIMRQLNENNYHFDLKKRRHWDFADFSLNWAHGEQLHDLGQVVSYDLANQGSHKKSISLYVKGKKYACGAGCSLSFSARKIKKVCSLFQFKNKTLRLIENRQKDMGIQHINMTETVSFHVRRGDKIREFAHTKIDDYVQLIGLKELQNKIKNCLVFSDSPLEVMPEFVSAVQRYNISCEIYPSNSTYINDHQINRNDFNSTLTLLAEVKSMLDSEYFIYTMTSNVAIVVSHLRGCKDIAALKKDQTGNLQNMFNSFHVGS